MLHRLAAATPVEDRVVGQQQDTEGSESHTRPYSMHLPAVRNHTDRVAGVPLALNFIASGECIRAMPLA